MRVTIYDSAGRAVAAGEVGEPIDVPAGATVVAAEVFDEAGEKLLTYDLISEVFASPGTFTLEVPEQA